MKKLLSVFALLVALAAPAQTNLITLNTNGSTPFLSGPLIDFASSLSTATNIGVAGFGILQPASGGHKATLGAGALVLYNVSKFVGTGVGIDYLGNQVTMPSAQVQFQAPLLIGGTNGVQLAPVAFTGVATPVSGMGTDNGSVVGLFGAGLDVKITGGFGAFYAIEVRTGQPAPWNLLGLRYSKQF